MMPPRASVCSRLTATATRPKTRQAFGLTAFPQYREWRAMKYLKMSYHTKLITKPFVIGCQLGEKPYLSSNI